MKKLYQILFIAIIFCSFCFNAQAQWKKVPISPAGFPLETLLDIFFLPQNPKLGWVCGYRSQIIRTTDGGNTWLGSVISGTNLQLESINFITDKIGFTSGGDMILRSDDGGLSWRNITPNDPQGVRIWGNYFYDANYGLCLGGGCGDPLRIYRTTDGGQRWSVYRIFTEPWSSNQLMSGGSDALLYSPNGLGYAVSSGIIWKTTDGGVSWSLFSISEKNRFDLSWQEDISHIGNSFLVPYAAGCNGQTGQVTGGLRFSSDNAASWVDFYTGYSMFGAVLTSDSTGWGVGFGRSVYYTSDRGKTWELRNCGIDPGDHLDDIAFVDTIGFVVGQKGIYKSSQIFQTPPIIQANKIRACEGDSIIISANRIYATSRWSTGEYSTSITVKKSGKYWLYAFDSECDSLRFSDTVEVFFSPKPALSIDRNLPSKICIGDTVTITASSPGNSLLWSNGASTQSIKVSSSGKYFVTASNSDGCTVTDSIEISFAPAVNPFITAFGDTSFCKGDSIVLRLDRQYAKIEWRTTDNDDVLGNDIEYRVFETGIYYAYVENEFGCSSLSNLISIEVKDDSNKLEIDFESSSINYDSVIYPELVCRQASIRNKTASDFILTNPYLAQGVAFSIPLSQLPLVFQPFETKEITVCYAPTKLELQRDTLIIPDVCSRLRVPLVALGEGNTYLEESPCKNEIAIKVIDIEKGYKFTASDPYPIPANSSLNISFLSTGGIISANMKDIFGNLIKKGTIEFVKDDKKGLISFNVASLTPGLYFIELINENLIIIKKALISK